MIEELFEAHEDDEPITGPVDDPMIARSLLIEYQRNERKAEMLTATARAVAQEYATRIEKAKARNDEIREQLLRFVQENGSVSFPEVGGVALRKAKPRPVVADPEALLAWMQAEHPSEVEVSYRVPASAVQAVVSSTGELPPGVDMETPEDGITIRKA